MQRAKNYIAKTITGLSLAVAMLCSLCAYAPQANAVQVINCNGIQTGQHVPAICENNQDKLFGPGSIWTRIINTLLIVIGAIALLMIVIGAMRYVLSGGDQSQITAAKNTILYSVIGIIIAMMAGGIVNFVLINV